MTRANSRRAVAFVATGVIALLASVLPAFAAGPKAPLTTGGGTTVQQDQAMICARISAVSTQVQDRLTQLRAQIVERRDERIASYLDRKAEHQEKAEARRQAWDGRWDALMIDLEAKATTSVQKTALVQFKADMRTAFAARKASVDAANNAFRTALNGALVARGQTITLAADPLKVGVKTAFDKAKADCASGVNADTVRATLRASLETTHASFRAAMQELDKIGPLARAYAETRRVAVEKANADFKVAAQKARDTFKLKAKATN